MDARTFFLDQHGFVTMVSKGVVYAGLSDDQLRRHPQAGQNSLAWLLWHATRCEDVMVNTWVAGQTQVVDRDNWLERLRMTDQHEGTAMTAAEATDLSERMDLDALRAYREAVDESTREVVASLRPEELDEVVDGSRLKQSAPDALFGNPRAQWMDELWANRTKGWILGVVNAHGAEQLIAEAICARSLGGFPLGL